MLCNMITDNYVLFTRITLLKNRNGEIYADPLWAIDLKEHTKYIDHFSLCCPVMMSDDVEKLTNVSHYKISRIYELNKDKGFLSVAINFIPNLFGVIKALRKAKIVHSGGAGWAFPLSFYILFLRPFFNFKWIILIESSFWMLNKKDKKTLRNLTSHYLHKYILKKCLKKADARIFTQSFYRQFFLGNEKENTLINPASWINEKYIVSPDLIKIKYQEKKDKVIKILYPSRLIVDKGTQILIDALAILDEQIQSHTLHLDIIGEGSFKPDLITLSQAENKLNIRVLEPIKYDQKFFNLLSTYDFILITNIKEEQPRIIFDAFSQGVAVIAPATSGVKDITTMKNAFYYEVGNPHSLANALLSVANDINLAYKLGLDALKSVNGITHKEMHKRRQSFIEACFSSKKG